HAHPARAGDSRVVRDDDVFCVSDVARHAGGTGAMSDESRTGPRRTAGCVLVFAALACLCVVMTASGQRGGPAPSLAIDDGRQGFEPGAEASTDSAIRKGALATAFNERDGERILRGVIRATPRSEEASQAHELLSRIYLRAGQYRRAIENLDRWAA